MKTITSVHQFKILVVFLFLLSSIRDINAQDIMINQSFSCDTVFNPFENADHIFSLKMTGGIQLLSDSSLVRVIFIDHYGGRWLVYEAYPMIDTLYTFTVSKVCDETCFLDGLVPDSIQVDIVNAIVTIDSLHLNNNYISNARELQAQAKWLNDSIKIAIMNRRISEDHMYWRAGRTDIVNMFYVFKEQYFNKKFNLSGIDFYKGGVYSNMSSESYSPSISDLVDNFDWRNRHDANIENTPYWDGETYDPDLSTGWITPIVNQFQCNSCWLFASVAAAEAYINLSFNNGGPLGQYKHQMDIKLSELEVLRCLFNYNTG